MAYTSKIFKDSVFARGFQKGDSMSPRMESLEGPKGILPIAKSMQLDLWSLPGHGEPYHDCGSWRSKGCLNVEGHNQQGILEDFVGKVFVRRYKRTCLRAECPVCYEKWAGKEAGKIEHRLNAWSFGRVVHVVVSPPVEDYGLSYPDLRRKAYAVAKKSGVLGGCCIIHPFREDEYSKKWFFSPHFHMLVYGWIHGSKEGYEKHGWIVRNVGVRKSVSGTALYQLSHAGIHEKYHTVTWFGRLSYNKLKVTPKMPEKEVCPICHELLKELWYYGSEDPPEVEGDYWLAPDNWVYKSWQML